MIPFTKATILAAIFAASIAAHAQSLDNPCVEGVLFFQEHAFSDPKTSAWPVEYRSVASNDKIIIVMADGGRKLRLLATQVPMILPYPGRGGLGRDQAIMLCDAALANYPQHARLIGNVRKAWTKVTPQDYVKNAPASAARQGVLTGIIDGIAAEAEKIRARVATAIRRPPSSPAETPSPTPAPDGNATGPEIKAGGPAEVQKNLELIKDYYKQSEKLIDGSN